MISLGTRNARKGLELEFGGGVKRNMEESELEEGEACSYNNNNDDYNTIMDPDIDLSYIDEKLQDVLGHFQKDFEGGVSAENLGAKFGGYGSFLPSYQRSPVWCRPRTPPKVQTYNAPISPNNLHQAGVHCESTALSTMTQSLSVGSASRNGSSLPSLKASSSHDMFNQDVHPPTHCSESFTAAHESANRKSSNFPEKQLTFRIRVGSDNLLTGKNTEIYSGLGLDGSPSSSLGESPSESEGMSHEYLEAPFESPTSILQIMTSFPVLGGLLLSPLPDALTHLKENCGSMPVRMVGPNSSKTKLGVAHSSRGDGKVSGEKKTISLENNDFSTKTEFNVGISGDAENTIDALSRNEADLDTLASELISSTLKLPLLSNSHTTVGDSSKVGRVSDMSEDACKGIRRGKVSSDCTKDEPLGPIFAQEDEWVGKSDPVQVQEDRNVSFLDEGSGYPRKDLEGRKPRNFVQTDSNFPKGGNVELPKKKAYQQVVSQGEEIMQLPPNKEQPSSGGKKKVKVSKSHNILDADVSKDSSRVCTSLVPKYSKDSHDGFATKKEYENSKLPKTTEKAEDTYREIFGDTLELEKEEKQLSSPEMLGEERLRDAMVVDKSAYFSSNALKQSSSGKKMDKAATSDAAASNVASRPGNGPFYDAASAAAASEDSWVCCDKCQKWRLLPLGTNPNDLPEKWLCSMLDWLPGMNRCSFSQDETTNAVLASHQVPVLDTQKNVQSNPGGAVLKGIFADALNPKQNDLRFGIHAMAAGGGKKKHGPKEISNAAGKAGTFRSSNSVKKNVQTSVRNGSLNDNNPSPGVSEPYFPQLSRQSEFTPERHKHKQIEKHIVHENNSTGGITKGSKLKSRRDSDLNGLTASKKIRTESLHCTDEDWMSDHGEGVGKVGHSSGTGSHIISTGKDRPRYNEHSSSKDLKCDKKDRLQFSVKQPKDQDVASLDNGSMRVENSEARDITMKKRRMKETQDSEIYPGSKKARVSKSEEKQSIASKGNGRTDKRGSHTKSQQMRLDPGSNLSQRSLEGMHSMKRDSGHIQPSAAATSSSSEVSVSTKSKASFHEARGSPVESVSYSPMRVENPDKFMSAKKCLIVKDDSCNADHFGVSNPRRCLDGENEGEGNRLGKARKEKRSEMAHHGSHESFVPDFPDKGLSHLSGVEGEAHTAPSSDIANHHFTNGDANQLDQNSRYHRKPTTLDQDLNEERRNKSNCRANGSDPRKSREGLSLHFKDKNQNSNSKFGVDNIKLAGPADALQDHQTSSKVKLRHKIKPQDKLGVDFDESGDRYLGKDSSRKSLSDSGKRESHLNFGGNDAAYIKLDAVRSQDQTSTPKQCLLQNCNGDRSSMRIQSHDADKVEKVCGRGKSLSAEPSERVQNGAISGLSVPDSGSQNGNGANNLPLEASEGENALKAPRHLRNLDHQSRFQQIIPRHSTANGQKVGDPDAPSPVRRDSSGHAAANLIKEAKNLKHMADRLMNSGSSRESTGLYFQAVLKFLQGASLFECSAGESKHGESQSMQIYGSTAKLCDFCAHEYEKCKDMANAALAYKCMEVAYFRVIYSKHTSANKVRRELQTALQIGGSPSSSASDIDNLNQLTVDKVPLPKGVSPPQCAGNPVIAARNRSHFVNLLDFAQDAIFAMEATRKSQIAFEAANVSLAGGQYKEGICSIKRALDFNFRDVEGFLHLVRLAVDTISP
ncbi:hypothetical protein HS088_TW17G00214 [Tripterygium wilfordii]|uniref:CW-type domain-containing protein n=1 Tax=Tripterygium wilfordii TaxID=458696 RepID=A0A7J7CES8_TRIWF|nr:cysteine-tryptophan domain-containing zinc finger protein 7-like [Tripterygium wilfordii]XP_038681105.1 cysteine-tryptophan domain-containing zinc finger protein 7-like [Tripterygium wilfordii]XP_038681106.1 cysteine-tryptophan domain-containing zinc finger protein 7-like [Tripterygium wilfordii]KAF5732684.1 hypothetical protein HS088_TW17G00214 [Tripterygium wilfordii]